MEGIDDNGHGSHCAGTVGARAFGVAKQVELVAVKVIDAQGVGNADDFLSGVEYILADHLERSSTAMAKSVALISMTFRATESVDDAVQELDDAGISVVVSAGNDNADACEFSPPRVPEALAVGK